MELAIGTLSLDEEKRDLVKARFSKDRQLDLAMLRLFGSRAAAKKAAGVS
jgi:hypothetical protein